ncbi:fungal-specific transcription factor domain-containing protein [Aspergillus avenaceus]|uniref:Fungal-specific transcription factor domain-containing protein n=1 Tax=Aspergillus avenaceus TaxID=36643 RepID=A0A5N6TMT6_ASPAV|nr:fungal-specific transcription factor domain-containing protein [Aspergillus avenaceus]
MRRVKKSRNGCARCKSKRVKCGEEKPHCARCTRLGVGCPGYVQSLRWVTEHPSTTDGNDNPNGLLGTSPRSGITPAPRASTTSPSALHLDTLAPTPQAEATVTHTPTLDLDETEELHDSLWGLPESGSLPELADLDPSPRPQSRVGPERSYSLFNNEPQNDIENTLNLFLSRQLDTQHEPPNYIGFSPSNIVRKYPPSNPSQPDITSITRPLNNPSWTLIEYYFKEVAALFSSYDSQMNPFRSTVSRLWGSSLAMCKTMQSMAAATLVHDFPQFGPLGRKLRNEAVDIVSNETTLDDKSLLALLMLGQTASWHDSADLGISFFNLLRNHLTTDPNQPSNNSNNHQFFEEALIYWEMLLSFVADDTAVLPGSSANGPLVLQRIPHPWTGIARETQFTVQEVGRLIRRERKRIRTRTFTSRTDIARAQKSLDKAQDLETRLLSLAHPTEAEIVSPGDNDTPVWHLLTMAEVYRCTGLMQLYRVFPDLLHRRLPDPANPFIQPQEQDPLNPWFNHPEPEPVSYYDTWLAEFALTTLSRLRSIPIESRTRCLQPFLLVAASSELRLPKSPDAEIALDTGAGISSHAIEVSRTRRFVLGRLTSFLHVLPPKPIDVCLQLVREVWRRMDADEPNVYWMDVMIEKGWETTMG